MSRSGLAAIAAESKDRRDDRFRISHGQGLPVEDREAVRLANGRAELVLQGLTTLFQTGKRSCARSECVRVCMYMCVRLEAKLCFLRQSEDFGEGKVGAWGGACPFRLQVRQHWLQLLFTVRLRGKSTKVSLN